MTVVADAPPAPPRATALDPVAAAGLRDRARLVAVCVLMTALVFRQSPGLVSPDTKLDLTADPARFLGRALHLWDPTAAFGQVQNQAYGYLFPMGPFFLAGHAAGLPGWVVQRCWQSLLLVLACVGVRRLADRLGMGTPGTRLLGGVVYALSPLVLAKLGPLSIEALPECLAPWVLLPLVGVGPGAERRAALTSGVAVFAVGGVNAAATLAALVLPALWLLTGPLEGSRRRLAAWWALAVGLATAWWVVPLVVLGAYSPPFLGWIESASVTTAPTGLLATLSGTSDWLGRLTDGNGPVWRGAALLVTSPLSVLDAAALAGLGLAGLALPSTRHRRFLLSSVAIGLLAVTFGHVATAGPPGAGMERHLLDTALAPFRNVHKFDLVLRLPLVLGLVALASRGPWQVAARSRAGPVPRASATRRLGMAVGRRPLAALAALLLVGVTLPLLGGQLEPAGSYVGLPGYWTDAAHWLESHDDGNRALLLPASPHGTYVWGTPNDEPLQALTTTRWAVRDAVPLGGAGETRILDAVQAVIQTGQGSPGLSGFLARAGVRWLVVRNDLDGGAVLVAPPVVVDAALQASPGIEEVAGFGPVSGSPRRAAVQIFRVTGGFAPTETMAPSGTTQLVGGPESVLALTAAGRLGSGQATVVTGSTVLPHAAEPAAVSTSTAVTDGNRRREVDFGQTTLNTGATVHAGDPWTLDRAVHSYAVTPADAQAVASDVGATQVLASSSASDPAPVWVHDTADTPEMAFDNRSDTRWVSGAVAAVGQWVQVMLPAGRQPESISVRAAEAVGPAVDLVRISTDSGAVTTPVSARPVTVRLPPGPAGTVRVTALGVTGGGPGATASLEVSLPGVSVARSLVIPAPAGPPRGVGVVALTAEPGGTGCVHLASPAATVCGVTAVGGEDDAALDRSFTLASGLSGDADLTARPVAGAALDRVLPTPGGLRITASSTLSPDPADGPVAALDAVTGAGWLSAASDPAPTLTLDSDTTLTIRSLVVHTAASLGSSGPASVVVAAQSGQQRGEVDRNGQVALRGPVTGRHFTLTFTRRTGLAGFGPVGISELRIPGTGGPPPTDAQVRLPCGQGPGLVVDGGLRPTQVLSTLGDVMSGRRATLRVCNPSGPLTLTEGVHRLRIEATATFRADSFTLGPPASPTPGRRLLGTARQSADAADYRLGAGPATWLVLHQNANAGWQATLDGHRLRDAALDGWQQGFLVPAGAAGRVVVSYAPDRIYRVGLLLGLLLAVTLLVGCALAVRLGPRPGGRRPSDPSAGTAPGLTLALSVAVVGALGSWVGLLVAALLAVVSRRLGREAGVRGTARTAGWLAAVAGGALAVAGALASVRHPAEPSGSGIETVAQVLCLLAVGCCLASGVLDEVTRRSSPAHRPPGEQPGARQLDELPAGIPGEDADRDHED